MAVFDFCPERYVPETLPPEPLQGMSLNGWPFTSKPEVPYQRRFKLTLHGMRWYLNDATGFFDNTTNPSFNAKRLEEFYAEHQTWKPFDFTHQHIGTVMEVRFFQALQVPAAPVNSGGLVDPFEIVLIHHNPGY